MAGDRKLEAAIATLIMATIMTLAGLLWLFVSPALAAEPQAHVADAGKVVVIPRDAHRYRADLTRSARLAWGLDAPVATFAAQIHQESAWRADARSHVGARGLAQFMPATEQWIDGAYATDLSSLGGAMNPTWALRALTRYDRWIWDRLPGFDRPCDRMAATLRSYNGGLGWLQKEARSGLPCRAFRSVASCRENLDYPRRILGRLEPVYVRSGWGHGVCS